MMDKLGSVTSAFTFSEENTEKYGTMPLVSLPKDDHRRRKVNWPALIMCILLPWLVFMFTFGCVAFSLHFTKPGMCWFAVACSALIVGVCGVIALLDRRKQAHLAAHNVTRHRREPTWFGYLLVATLIAWFLGVLLGDSNFETYMATYYNMMSLKSYPAVDPGSYDGRAVADAGRVFFSPGSRLDKKRAANFRNEKSYCVAPFVPGPHYRLASYDFWAAGVDCCSNDPGDFNCYPKGKKAKKGEVKALGGLRIVDDALLPYYRLAVEQAQVRYNMTAQHPLFFTYTGSEDPILNLNKFRDLALKGYMFWGLLFFGINCTCVALRFIFFKVKSDDGLI